MFFAAHSGIRYLVFLAAAATIVWALYGIMTKRPYDKTMATLASTYTGLLHLEVVLGIATLLSRMFASSLIGHIFMMLAAAAVAQIVSSVMRRRPMEKKTYMPHLIGTILSVALVVGGIMAIGRGAFESTVG